MRQPPRARLILRDVTAKPRYVAFFSKHGCELAWSEEFPQFLTARQPGVWRCNMTSIRAREQFLFLKCSAHRLERGREHLAVQETLAIDHIVETSGVHWSEWLSPADVSARDAGRALSAMRGLSLLCVAQRLRGIARRA